MITYTMFKSLQSFFEGVEKLGYSVVFGSKEVGVLNVKIFGSKEKIKRLKVFFNETVFFNEFLDNFNEMYYVDSYFFSEDTLHFRYISRCL